MLDVKFGTMFSHFRVEFVSFYLYGKTYYANSQQPTANSQQPTASVKLFQIYYNEETRNQLDSACIPLDNCNSPKPEWYEFYPIKNFLDHNELEENTYYGFLSPRFQQKTCVSPADLIKLIEEKSQENIDVFLSSLGFNVIAYHQNLFIQGEAAHPGITDLTQRALDKLNVYCDVKNMVSSLQNSAFCNYIVGNKAYWTEWKALADKFYDLVENDHTELGEALRANTHYWRGDTSMRTFIQERLPAVILASNKYRTFSFGVEWNSDMLDRLPKYEICNYFKVRYSQTKDPMDLLVYKHIRNLI